MSEKENTRLWWESKYAASQPYSLWGKEPAAIVQKFSEFLPAKSRVLEIACGEGRNAVALALKGHSVFAIDGSQTAVARANELAAASKVSIETKSMDLDFFIPDLLAFDGVVSSNFRMPTTLLKNVARGLKAGGLFLMEAHLMKAAEGGSTIEAFQCFKRNELIQYFSGPASSFQLLYYSEIDGPEPGHKVLVAARKSQLL